MTRISDEPDRDDQTRVAPQRLACRRPRGPRRPAGRARARRCARRAAQTWYRVGRLIRERIHLQVGLAKASSESWPFGGTEAADQVHLLYRRREPFGQFRDAPPPARRGVTTLTGAARPGMKRSVITCSPSTDCGGVRNASEKSSGSRPPTAPSAPATRISVTVAAVAAGARDQARRPCATAGSPARRSTLDLRHGRPERAAAERAEDRGQQRQAGGDHHGDAEREDRAHLPRGVEVGQREHEHRDDHDRSGATGSPARCARSRAAIASPTSAVRRSSSRKRATISRQ